MEVQMMTSLLHIFVWIFEHMTWYVSPNICYLAVILSLILTKLGVGVWWLKLRTKK